MEAVQDQPSRLPFLLNFVDRVEPDRYQVAIQAMDSLSSSYDLTTQTSAYSLPSMGGTSLTYTEDTGLFNTDTQQTDT